MAKMKETKAYFGLSQLISVILAIIAPIGIICSVVTRIMAKDLLGAILNIFLFPIFWIVDLITIILNQKIILLSK